MAGALRSWIKSQVRRVSFFPIPNLITLVGRVADFRRFLSPLALEPQLRDDCHTQSS